MGSITLFLRETICKACICLKREWQDRPFKIQKEKNDLFLPEHFYSYMVVLLFYRLKKVDLNLLVLANP